MSTGNLAEPPFLMPGTGRIVRQTGPDTAEPVVEGLMFPIAMELGPDGAFYVSTPAIGANDGSGAIVRVAMAGSDGAARPPARPPSSAATAGECAPIEGTTGTMPAPPSSTPGSAPTSGSDPAAAPADATVTIADFSFGPADLSVAAGTTVTFVNDDSSAAYGDGR